METIQLKLFCGEIGESGEVEERIRLSLICKKKQGTNPVYGNSAPFKGVQGGASPSRGTFILFGSFFSKKERPLSEGKGP